MTGFTDLAGYVRSVHDPRLAEMEGSVYMVFQDFEIAVQKSGPLLWQRTLHRLRSGISDVSYEMPVMLENGNSLAYIPDAAYEYIKNTLKRLTAKFDISAIIQEHGLTTHTEGGEPPLSIIVIPQEKRGVPLPPRVKGLIFNREEVVCPGVIIPEDITTLEQFDRMDDAVASVEGAFDGVLFRLYHQGEGWTASTNGQINPTKGWGGRSFAELFWDPEVQIMIDYSVLNRAYCYYVLLEHKEHINVIPHFKSRLILVDAVTVQPPFTPIPINLIEGFTHVQIRQRPILPCDIFSLANTYKIGLVATLKSGRTIRIESDTYKYMASLRSNIPDVYKQWIHKLSRPSFGWSVEEILFNAERDIREYLAYFTWHTDKFNYMRELFLDIFVLLSKKLETPAHVFIPKRLMKFYRELQPEEQTAEGVLRKLIEIEERHLFYLMNPYNVEV
jgi:hypothetical protein